jgi:hypothetical protein
LCFEKSDTTMKDILVCQSATWYINYHRALSLSLIETIAMIVALFSISTSQVVSNGEQQIGSHQVICIVTDRCAIDNTMLNKCLSHWHSSQNMCDLVSYMQNYVFTVLSLTFISSNSHVVMQLLRRKCLKANWCPSYAHCLVLIEFNDHKCKI